MKHLKSVNMTYWSHLKETLKLFITFQKLSMISIIHGVIPDLFTTHVSSTIREMERHFRIRDAKLKCCQGSCQCQK